VDRALLQHRVLGWFCSPHSPPALNLTFRSQAALGSIDVWAAPWLRVRTTVRDGVRAAEAWSQACSALTASSWPTNDANPWREGPFEDSGLKALAARLDAITRLRRCVGGGHGLIYAPRVSCAHRCTSPAPRPFLSTHEEICVLTTPEGRRAMGLDATLRLLSTRGAATSIAATSDAEWEAAVAAYEHALEAVDTQVGAVSCPEAAESHHPLKVFDTHGRCLERGTRV
jgi:hypothetical protein